MALAPNTIVYMITRSAGEETILTATVDEINLVAEGSHDVSEEREDEISTFFNSKTDYTDAIVNLTAGVTYACFDVFGDDCVGMSINSVDEARQALKDFLYQVDGK